MRDPATVPCRLNRTAPARERPASRTSAPEVPCSGDRADRLFSTSMTIANAPLETEVIAIVKRVSRRPIEPTVDSDLALDLGFDSLLVFELIAELEDRFDVSIPLNDIEKIRTIAQVSDHLRDLIAQQGGARGAAPSRRRPTTPRRVRARSSSSARTDATPSSPSRCCATRRWTSAARSARAGSAGGSTGRLPSRTPTAF